MGNYRKSINISKKRSLDDYYILHWSHPALIASITEYKRILCNRKCESRITLPRQIHDPGFREQIKCCQNKAAHFWTYTIHSLENKVNLFFEDAFLGFTVYSTYIQYLMCTLGCCCIDRVPFLKAVEERRKICKCRQITHFEQNYSNLQYLSKMKFNDSV